MSQMAWKTLFHKLLTAMGFLALLMVASGFPGFRESPVKVAAYEASMK